MPIKLGNLPVDNVCYGPQKILKAYLGTDDPYHPALVFSNSPTTDEITWTVSPMTGNENDVFNVGTTVWAYSTNLNELNINDVHFTNTLVGNTTNFGNGNLVLNEGFAGIAGSGGTEGISGDYGKLLNDMLVSYSTNKTVTVTLGNLVPNQKYLVQFFIHNSGSTFFTNTASIDANEDFYFGNDNNEDDDHKEKCGFSYVGTFTATKNKVSFNIWFKGTANQLNAIQLRTNIDDEILLKTREFVESATRVYFNNEDLVLKFNNTEEVGQFRGLENTEQLADILVVAGGGSGGSSGNGYGGGGGGAGGLIENKSVILKVDSDLTKTYKAFVGATHTNSSLLDLDDNIVYEAIRGGNGSSGGNAPNGEDGGSGGGCGGNVCFHIDPGQGVAGQGNMGGYNNAYSGGGGGGFSEVGKRGSDYSHGGNGGNGYVSDITGKKQGYACGGGGAGQSDSNTGTGGSVIIDGKQVIVGGNGTAGAGKDGTGSGGGGGGSSPRTAGGKGGSGTVIVRLKKKTLLERIRDSVQNGESYYVEGDEQWVRFTATSNQEFIQLSEFYLYDEFGNRINLNLTPQESLADKNTCWANFPSWSTQSVQYLFDSNDDTKWGITEKSSVVTMHLGNGHKIASYNLRSGNDTSAYPERAVVSWKLEWSSDGTNWITLDEKTSSDTAGDPALVNNKMLYNNGNPYRISPKYSRSSELVVKFTDTTNNGSVFVPSNKGLDCDYLVVGGGGAGGGSYLTNNRSGGGGAGGLLESTLIPVTGTYSTVVGIGAQSDKTNGSDSSISLPDNNSIVAVGGGCGGYWSTEIPHNGGSGGGGIWGSVGGKAIAIVPEQYFKLVITHRVAGVDTDTDTGIEIGELSMFDASDTRVNAGLVRTTDLDEPNSFKVIIAPPCAEGTPETVEKIFDGQFGGQSKLFWNFARSDFGKTIATDKRPIIIMRLTNKSAVVSYNIASGQANLPERIITGWELYYSSNNVNWTLVDKHLPDEIEQDPIVINHTSQYNFNWYHSGGTNVNNPTFKYSIDTDAIQGHNGGAGNWDTAGGGGGGAGSKGYDGSSSLKGQGGEGIQSNITGETKWYAAGGSGAASNVSVNGIGGKGQAGVQGAATAGVNGTGSGGGGGSNLPGKGGSGIVALHFYENVPSYNVTLNTNDGTIAKTSVVARQDRKLPVLNAKDLPDRTGYLFDGYCYEGWEVTRMTGENTDIITDGEGVFAYSAYESYTVNGVSFENKFTVGSDTFTKANAPTMTFSVPIKVADAQSGDAGKSGDYGKMMKDKMYVTYYSDLTVTLSGLTPGQSYLVQIVCHKGDMPEAIFGLNVDGVSYCCHSNTWGDDSKSDDENLQNVPYGRSFVHKFKADSDTHSFDVKRYGPGLYGNTKGQYGIFVQFNAFQLRKLDTDDSFKYYDKNGNGVKKWDIGKDATLNAKWKFKTSTTLSFNGNGGDMGGTTTLVATLGEPLPDLISPLPTREGWTFAGCKSTNPIVEYYDAQGKGTRIWDREDSNVTLFAQWIQNS